MTHGLVCIAVLGSCFGMCLAMFRERRTTVKYIHNMSTAECRGAKRAFSVHSSWASIEMNWKRSLFSAPVDSLRRTVRFFTDNRYYTSNIVATTKHYNNKPMFVLFTLIYAIYSHLTHCEFAFKFVWHYLNFQWKCVYIFINRDAFENNGLISECTRSIPAFLVNPETAENAQITAHAKHNKSSLRDQT